MWIFLSDAFFSIVEDKKNPMRFSVRARYKGDIEKVFHVKESSVLVTPRNDYRFRVFLPKDRVIQILSEEMANIDYTNFKDSIPSDDKGRYKACTKVWQAMYDWQSIEYPDQIPWYEEYYEKRYDKYKEYEKYGQFLLDKG